MCQALGTASCGITLAVFAPVLMSIVTFSTGEAEARKAKLGGGEEVDSLGSRLPSGAIPGEQKPNIHLCSSLCLQQVAAYWEGAGPGLQEAHRGRHHWLLDLHHAQKTPFLSCRCHGQKTRVQSRQARPEARVSSRISEQRDVGQRWGRKWSGIAWVNIGGTEDEARG